VRRKLIVLLTFLGGLYYFLEFVTPKYLPTSVPTAYHFVQTARQYAGAPESDEVARFAEVEAACAACRDLDIIVDLPEHFAGRTAGLTWTKTGRMFGRIGVRMDVPAEPGDPSAISGWKLVPAFNAHNYKTFESVQDFQNACKENGGKEVEGEEISFKFDSGREAVSAARKVGVDVEPVPAAADMPAVMTRLEDGRLEVGIERSAGDEALPPPGWTVQTGRWSREYPEHVYFMLGGHHEMISDAFIVIFVAAVGLGVINILRAHGMRTIMRRKGWVYSAALMVSMAAMIFAGFYDWHNDVTKANATRLEQRALAAARVKAVEKWEAEPDSARPEASSFKDLTAVDPARDAEIKAALPSAFGEDVGLFYKEVLMGLNGLFTGLSSAIFSLLALYIAAAAYRAFRIKSGEAALMMLTALLVMLGQIPMGTAACDPLFRLLGVEGGIAPVRSWIMEVINAAAFRGIFFGASIAGLAMGIRMWLSMEMGSFYKD